MGVSEKHQVEGGLESEGKKWVIAGIQVRAPLKKIRSKKIEKDAEESEEEESCSCTTPTTEEARIPDSLPCPPPPPRKPRPSLKCNFSGVRFFNPPDLESVFIRRVET